MTLHSTENYKKLWDKLSDTFGRTIFHPQYFAKKYAWEAVEWAEKDAKGILLDIGCGRMPYRNTILPNIEKYIGLDHPETSNLYHGEYKPDIYADATSIPLKDKSVDTVIMLMVLEHLPNPQKALSEIKRVLKPDGIFIASTVQMYPIHDAPYDYFRYTKYGLKDMCKNSGFKIIKIKSRGNFWVFWCQSLNVFLFKSLKSIIKNHCGIIAGILLLPFLYPISLISNIIAVILAGFDNENDSAYNITHTFLAKIQI